MGTLLIRADANGEIGTGHVMRCLALAQAWQDKGGNAHFRSAELPSRLAEKLLDQQMETMSLTVSPGGNEDAEQMSELADRIQAEWIICDGYQFGREYQRLLQSSGRRLMVIDDFGTIGHYAADLILDQNLGSAPNDYSDHEPGARLFLGPRFALLRREFSRLHDRARFAPSIARKVLVTLGGADAPNVTAKVMRALASVRVEEMSVRVVIGLSNPHHSALVALAAEVPYAIELISDTDRMHEIMAWADLAITAGGSTCWELCRLGVPQLVLILADNQQRIAGGLAVEAQQVNLGWFDQCSEATIACAAEEVMCDFPRRKAMTKKIRSLVDGQGAKRMVEAMCANREQADADSVSWQ